MTVQEGEIQQGDVELNDHDAFDAAFDSDSEQDTGDADPGEQSGDDSDEGEAWGESDTGEQAAGDDKAGKKPSEKPADETGDEVDWSERYAALEHKTKSWEGRLSATARENERLKRELEQAKTGTAGQGESGEGASSTVAAATLALDDFFDEYPDLKDPLTKLVEQAVSQAVSQVDTKYKPILSKAEQMGQRAEKEQAEAHTNAILQAHPDVFQVSGSTDMQAWINELPPYRQKIATAVIQDGDAQDVIELLTDYKTARGIKTKGRSVDETKDSKGQNAEAIRRRREQQADDAQVVRSGRTHVPRGKPDADDFDGAWDEAVSK